VQLIGLDAEIKLGDELKRLKKEGNLDRTKNLKRGPELIAEEFWIQLKD
jgi:hypothetical protein